MRHSEAHYLGLAGALHHVKEHHEVPYTGVQAVDQIGRAVVGSLSREGRAAAGGHSTWGRWVRTWSGYATLAGEHENETEARRAGLGERLKIDEWGSLMLVSDRPATVYFGHETTGC